MSQDNKDIAWLLERIMKKLTVFSPTVVNLLLVSRLVTSLDMSRFLIQKSISIPDPLSLDQKPNIGLN